MSTRVDVAKKYEVVYDEMFISPDEFIEMIDLITKKFDEELVMYRNDDCSIFELNPCVLTRISKEYNGIIDGTDISNFVETLLNMYDKRNDFIHIELW